MDKWKLIEITLNQLAEQWKHNRELFQSDDKGDQDPTIGNKSEDPYVSWQPPKKSNGEQQQLGLIEKSVTITYSPKGRFFKCEIRSTRQLPASDRNDTCIIARRSCIPIRSLYWNFQKLRKQIKRYNKTKENNKYLDDLCKIFPGTLDNYILGDDDE